MRKGNIVQKKKFPWCFQSSVRKCIMYDWPVLIDVRVVTKSLR